MKRLILVGILAVCVLFVAAPATAKVIPDAIWYNGDLFGTTITPRDIPANGPFDILYNFDNTAAPASGLSGQRSVSDAAPGTVGYNGGRWDVRRMIYTATGITYFDQVAPFGVVDPGKELMSVDDVMDAVQAGYLTEFGTVRHFVCPLHPQT